MSIKQAVAEQLAKLPVGQPFDVQSVPLYTQARKSVSSALSQLAVDGVVRRLARDVYYRPEHSRFGPLPPRDSDVMAFALQQTDGFIVGAAYLNNRGLSTQVPTVIEIASSKTRPRVVTYGKLKFNVVRAICAPVYPGDKRFLQMLHTVDRLRRLEGADPDHVVVHFVDEIAGLERAQRERLEVLSLQARPGVRALIGAMLEKGAGQSSVRLSQSISAASNYLTPVSIQVLPDMRKWQLRSTRKVV
ncbi:DUF6088 family protein [Permianibacter aggregans]|uniref:Uncharacterized protein n=1 Tax=Permianibacter aggregans TaxID=1510150 RepID=A0A4R6UT65_9GAMM|nr:DUF6088 family protein [Permianibacter aggregans]QGX40155.1 hypothetical protein E2H98_10925 [Permianibacter aggregans]TDQ49029.1 hypothetical protein EV696_1053 [Permianibacter aggregans]